MGKMFTNIVGNAANLNEIKKRSLLSRMTVATVFSRRNFPTSGGSCPRNKGGNVRPLQKQNVKNVLLNLESQNWFYSKWKSVRMALKGSVVIIVYVLLTFFSSLFVYALSVNLGHIDPVLPFYSETGSQPIESTVFTQLFVIDAAVLMLVVQIRFVYVTQMLKRRYLQDAQSLNELGLAVGFASALGLFILSCFQESHAYYVHCIALLVYLVASVVYCGIHARLSKLLDSMSTPRLILTVLMCACFVTFCVEYVVALEQSNKPWEERFHWSKDEAGWRSHLVSAASEWILKGLFQVYISTFYEEFQSVLLINTRIIVLSE